MLVSFYLVIGDTYLAVPYFYISIDVLFWIIHNTVYIQINKVSNLETCLTQWILNDPKHLFFLLTKEPSNPTENGIDQVLGLSSTPWKKYSFCIKLIIPRN